MCPVLAVTTSVKNGVGMGLATTAVLACSNIVVSTLKKFIPDSVRIPAYVVVIASFVTIVQFLTEGFFPDLNASLGIYIPLITVNCIILARAESYASKNGVVSSFLDGVGMGAGFTAALIIIGAVRELLGAGTVYGFAVLPDAYPRANVMLMPPGAFLTLGLLIAGVNYIRRKIDGRRGN